jgi:hypothetical protein
MAVSLGFGILIATAIIMLVVPALSMLQYRATERIHLWRGQARSGSAGIGWAGEG